MPAATGDITLFNPPGAPTAGAIDVSATITNVRSTCTSEATRSSRRSTSTSSATAAPPGRRARWCLPYFSVAVQGGSNVAAKRIGAVALNFPAEQLRAQTRGQATVRVSRGRDGLPADIARTLTRQRKAGDPDAAVDPLTDPTIRAAVARATFEHLVGFQLTNAQLRYNATR